MTLDWLGGNRRAWRVTSAKAVFRERREPNTADDEHLTPSQQYGVLPQSEYMRITGTQVVQNLTGQDTMKHVEPNDFVIHLRSFQGGIEHSKFEGKVSTAYTVLEPGAIVEPRYFRWLLKSDGYVQELRTTTNQLRDGQSIKFRDFTKVQLPTPPTSEQRAIGDYLDRETDKIDALIEKQERLIATLRDRRGSQVAAAVYESQHPGSGRLKHAVTNVRQGWSPQCNAWPADGVGTWGVLKAGAANAGRFRPEENKELPVNEIPRPDTVVRAGEVIVSRANTRDLVGSAAVVVGDYPRLMLCDKLYAFALDPERADPEYVTLTLGTRRWRDLIELEATGVSHSMQNISQADILSISFNPPPVTEQLALVQELRAQTERIDVVIEKAEHLIELSRERRAALITAAVTGQIDVPGAA